MADRPTSPDRLSEPHEEAASVDIESVLRPAEDGADLLVGTVRGLVDMLRMDLEDTHEVDLLAIRIVDEDRLRPRPRIVVLGHEPVEALPEDGLPMPSGEVFSAEGADSQGEDLLHVLGLLIGTDVAHVEPAVAPAAVALPRERELILAEVLERLARDAGPLVLVPLGEVHIAPWLCHDVSQVEFVCVRKRQGVHLGAADDEDILRLGHLENFVHAARDFHAVDAQTSRVAGQNDVLPARKRFVDAPQDRAKRFAPLNDGMTHRDFLEPLEVIRQVPRKFLGVSDDPIGRDRGNNLECHRLLRYRELDARIGVIVLEREVRLAEVEDVLHARIVDEHRGERLGLPCEELLHLLELVLVDLRIEEVVYVLVRLDSHRLRHHEKQRCVLRDVRDDADRHVSRALNVLERHLAIDDRELQEVAMAGCHDHLALKVAVLESPEGNP